MGRKVPSSPDHPVVLFYDFWEGFSVRDILTYRYAASPADPHLRKECPEYVDISFCCDHKVKMVVPEKGKIINRLFFSLKAFLGDFLWSQITRLNDISFP